MLDYANNRHAGLDHRVASAFPQSEVVAEGVETEPQAALLQAPRLRRDEGYLYSKPLSAEELIAACHLLRPRRVEGDDLGGARVPGRRGAASAAGGVASLTWIGDGRSGSPSKMENASVPAAFARDSDGQLVGAHCAWPNGSRRILKASTGDRRRGVEPARDRRAQHALRARRGESAAGGEKLPRRILLSWYRSALHEEQPALLAGGGDPGERCLLTVRLRRPRGQVNPHGYDYEGGSSSAASARPATCAAAARRPCSAIATACSTRPNRRARRCATASAASRRDPRRRDTRGACRRGPARDHRARSGASFNRTGVRIS